jgi:HPt (histidine-containing phosphotransfer) domain-containing protein
MRHSKNHKDSGSVATYGDHEVIVVENKLRKALVKGPVSPDDDPVKRAEQALAALSGEFTAWMEAECERLDAARRDVVATGLVEPAKDTLFNAAHDIKGHAATFGYPAIGSAAASLCRLIELSPDVARIPLRLIEQHVDAMRAIYREYARSDGRDLAAMLNKRLRDITDEFLLNENRDRPDVLEQIKGPSIAPE